MILKKLFSKSFLSRRPQTAKSPPALQAVAALGDRLEGVKSPLAGDFRSFIFSFYIIAYFLEEVKIYSILLRESFSPFTKAAVTRPPG
mgnify:CR=1 FL=1